jgi:hypothetical protein
VPGRGAFLPSSTLPRRAAGPTTSAPLPPTPSAFGAPPEGVYAYATAGYEKVSLGDARHDYPSESFTTVRHRGACQWEAEHRVVEEHVETHLYCGEPGVLEFLAETERVTFFGQTNTRTYRCDPPEIVARVGDAGGSARQFLCRSNSGGQSQVTVTDLGREAVSVGGGATEGLHVVVDGRQSGDAEGSSRVELWVQPFTGLALREIVHVQTRSHAFGVTVDYQEDASYTLEHLSPTT